MKKSSLLAVSLASLVALVGCNKKPTPKPVVKSESFKMTEFITEALLGPYALQFVEEMKDLNPNWVDEDAVSQAGLYVEWHYSEEFTPADLNAEMLYNEFFVGEEEPADPDPDDPEEPGEGEPEEPEAAGPAWAAVEEKYGEDLITTAAPGLYPTLTGGSVYGGDWSYYGVENEVFNIDLQFNDFVEYAEDEEGNLTEEVADSGIYLLLRVEEYELTLDYLAAMDLAKFLFGPGGLALVHNAADVLPDDWISPNSEHDSVVYYETTGYTAYYCFLAMFAGSETADPLFDGYIEQYFTDYDEESSDPYEEGATNCDYIDWVTEDFAIEYYFQVGGSSTGTYLVMQITLWDFSE